MALHPGRMVEEPERQPYVHWTTCYDFEETWIIDVCSCIKSPIFLLEALLRQCVFCKDPLSFWFASILRSFGPSVSEYECCAYPIPLFYAALKLIHEKNSQVRPCMLELFHPQDFPDFF